MAHRRWIGLMVVAVVLLAGFACDVMASSGGIPVRIAWQPYNSVIFYTMRDLKIPEQVGLDPVYIKFTAGPPQFAAFQSNSIDVGLFGTTGMVVGASQGLDYKNFYISIASSYNDGLVARAGSGINRLEDLKGKRIAYMRGTSAHFALVKALQKAGLQPSDVLMLAMDVTNVVPAFSRGDVDAAYSWEPWVSRMREAGGKLLLNTRELGLNTSDNWVVRTAWAQQNPEAMTRLIKAIDLAVQEFRRNPSVAIKATAENLGVSEAMSRDIVMAAPVFAPAELVAPDGTLSLVAGGGGQRMVQDVADFLLKEGIIRAPVDAAKLVDGSYIEKYLKSR